MGIFQPAMLVYQRVYIYIWVFPKMVGKLLVSGRVLEIGSIDSIFSLPSASQALGLSTSVSGFVGFGLLVLGRSL